MINNLLTRKLIIIVIISSCSLGCTTDVPVTDLAAPKAKPIRVIPIHHVKDIMDTKKTPFIEYPTPENFSICYGHTCRYIAETGLSEKEWSAVKEIFRIETSNPEQERNKIRDAIALLESIIGEKTNTSNDKGKNFPGLGLKGQLDCIDESINTTVYLTILQNTNLMKWHQVSHRRSRGIFSLQAPHSTAVIREKDYDLQFAVDSWFLDNGHPPYIVPLDIWLSGWSP